MTLRKKNTMHYGQKVRIRNEKRAKGKYNPALKYELEFYKRQLVPVKKIYSVNLEHLRLHQSLSREEVMEMPKDLVTPLLQHKIAKALEDAVKVLPIETEFDEDFGVYRASLDLWVKPKGF